MCVGAGKSSEHPTAGHTKQDGTCIASVCDRFCPLTCVLSLQMMAQSGGLLPEQIMSYGSINSYNSQESIGSGGRGAAMSKAFQKAQQQVQSGVLSEAQVCASLG